MNYWKECISEAFEDAGIDATETQIECVTGWVDGAHENCGMARGYDVIPNPQNTEIERLKKEIRNLKDRHDRQLWGVREGVAKRRNVEPEDVMIDDNGHVTYDLI